MKKLLCAFTLLVSFSISFAQSISITTSNTASICYNDGSLTVNATGGTAPYTDSILSGPSNPNLTYPIALPTGQNVFTNLPHGAFTISVTDANGLSGTFTASVGGTYEFPHDTLIQNSSLNGLYGYGQLYTDTLFCTVTPGTGTAPYQYAISSTGASSGFGSYQNQDFFSGLCAGQYWVRVIDNCGNIYTNTYLVTYNLYTGATCVNFANNSVSLTAFGGFPPYTYNIVYLNNPSNPLATSTTGVFNSLPFSLTDGSIRSWIVTDSCGNFVQSLFFLLPQLPTYGAPCPFTGTAYASIGANDANYVGIFEPIVFSCLSCSPVQNDTFNPPASNLNIPIFTGLQSDSTYIFQLTDGCANVYTDTVTVAPAINIRVVNLNCRSIKCLFTFADGTTVPLSDIDSVEMTYKGVTYTSLNGIFYDLPPRGGNDVAVITAFTNIGCNSSYSFYPEIPYFPWAEYAEHGPGCELVWNNLRIIDTADHENIFLISDLNDTLFGQPLGNGNYLYPYLQPSTHYTEVSDSGCIGQYSTGPYPVITNSVNSVVTCQGVPEIIVSGIDNFAGFTSEYITKIYHNGTLAFPPDIDLYSVPINNWYHTYTFYPTDTGFYQYKIYRLMQDFSVGGHLISVNTMYDTLCPWDSGTVFVTHISTPFPYVNTAYECAGFAETPPVLTIYGGEIPYTVQIEGVDTLVMHTNSINFPTTQLGTYNVIAYDNCGISRSFTFSILDTCCNILAISNDTSICSGGDAFLSITPHIGGGTYQWLPGGYTTQNITVSPTIQTPYTATYTQTGCQPTTDTIIVYVTPPPTLSVNDTVVCSGSPVRLTATPSPTGGTYSWSPGGSSTQSITVTPGGNATYTVTYSFTGCSPVVDSGHVAVSPLPTLLVTDTSVCTGAQAVLTATPSQAGGSYSWSPGGATTQSITISPIHTATYTVTYNLAGCTPVVDSGYVTVSSLPTLSVNDTSTCSGTPVSLTATPSQGGGTYSWSPGGANTQSITVSATHDATYTVTYYVAGCTGVTDSGNITVSALPFITVPIASTCAGVAVTLTASASQTGGSWLWTPGNATTQSITVAPDTTTTYTVQYLLPPCGAVYDEPEVTVIQEPSSAWTYTHTGSTYHFTSGVTGGGPFTYQWSFGDGATSDSANPTHIYNLNKQTADTVTLIVTGACGSDTVKQVIVLNAPLGDNDLSPVGHVSIYPNPNQGSFTIAIDNVVWMELNAEVTDVLGRGIYHQTLHSGENKFDLNLASGVYMVKVSYGELSTVKMMTIK